MTKVMIDRELLERIRELLYIIGHRQDDYGVEAEYLGNILSKVLANSAQRIVVESVPAGCKVVPVELLERAVYNMELAEMDGPTCRELRALLASAEGVKDE